MDVWTQQVRFAWRHPLVSFVAEQGAILQDLDSAGLLRRYVIEEERVGVRIKDPLHQIAFSPDAIELSAFQPAPDVKALTRAAEIVWARLKLAELRRVDLDCRFLTKTDAEYSEARQQAGDRLMPRPQGIKNIDFAMVADLESEDEPRAKIKVEWGIVNQREAAERLAFQQQALREGHQVPPNIFPAKSLPEVSIYDHQVWHVADLDLQTREEAFDLWSKLRAKAEEVDVALSERVIGESE